MVADQLVLRPPCILRRGVTSFAVRVAATFPGDNLALPHSGCLSDYDLVYLLGLRYRSVNFGAKGVDSFSRQRVAARS